MCDYKELDTFKNKEEYFKYNKIVIYNKVFNVMKPILNLFKRKKNVGKR